MSDSRDNAQHTTMRGQKLTMSGQDLRPGSTLEKTIPSAR